MALFLSDQYDTRQAPLVALATDGVVCEVLLPGSAAPTMLATGLVASVPRYAARVIAILT